MTKRTRRTHGAGFNANSALATIEGEKTLPEWPSCLTHTRPRLLLERRCRSFWLWPRCQPERAVDQSEAAACKDQGTVAHAQQGRPAELKAMIDRGNVLPLLRQAERLSRSGVCCLPRRGWQSCAGSTRCIWSSHRCRTERKRTTSSHHTHGPAPAGFKLVFVACPHPRQAAPPQTSSATVTINSTFRHCASSASAASRAALSVPVRSRLPPWSARKGRRLIIEVSGGGIGRLGALMRPMPRARAPA